MQCIIFGTVYMVLLFYRIKFMGYRNFQIFLCNLKLSDFLLKSETFSFSKNSENIFSIRGNSTFLPKTALNLRSELSKKAFLFYLVYIIVIAMKRVTSTVKISLGFPAALSPSSVVASGSAVLDFLTSVVLSGRLPPEKSDN